MSEILPCPVCGKTPGWHDFDIEARIVGGERSYFCCGMKASTAKKWNAYATLEARHRALVEAVAWERECRQDIRPLTAWAGLYVRHGEDYVNGVAEDLRAIQDAARAEVDRLLNDGADDCEGEG